MGNSLSAHEMFLDGVKISLRARGIRVKRKDLRQFFEFVHDTCPWFPLEGTINQKRWERVGDALQDFYRALGPEKIPVTAFSYWNLIHDILKIHSQDPDVKEVIKTGEEILKENSRPPSTCPSVVIDLPGEPPETPKDQKPLNIKKEPEKPQEKIPNIYPSLTFKRDHSDHLTPEEQETLDEEAARYHDDPWRLTAPALHRPPPYNPNSLVHPSPLPDFNSRPSDPIRQAKITLAREVSSLKEILQQKREHVQLIKEIQALEAELSTLSPTQQNTPPSTKSPPNRRKTKTKAPPQALSAKIQC